MALPSQYLLIVWLSLTKSKRMNTRLITSPYHLEISRPKVWGPCSIVWLRWVLLLDRTWPADRPVALTLWKQLVDRPLCIYNLPENVHFLSKRLAHVHVQGSKMLRILTLEQLSSPQPWPTGLPTLHRRVRDAHAHNFAPWSILQLILV